MTAEFYIVSLGPGNPELITIQALKTLESSDVIFVPVRSSKLEWKGSVAYQILKNIHNTNDDWFKTQLDSFNFIKKWEEKFVPIYTPMSYDPESWKDQVEQIVNACNVNTKVSFVTLGDAALFSSAYYLLDIIAQNHPLVYDNTKIVSGISSLSYASALVKKPLCLGNSKLEIVPVHGEELQSTKVYMRLHKGDDLSDLQGNDLYYFENF